ncbi:MAG: ATP-binding protein, partial [Gemmatimonadota bacterium]|nr:ATP-binding protein [Gemmatimonadota bacterium]
ATEGYPYFLQEFGKEAWDIADGPDEITLADVDAAIPIAINEHDTGFFRVRIDRTTDTERAYLAAMASLGAGPYGSGEVAAAMGKTTTQVGPHRDTLIKRGLCYSPRHGIIAFTVPMFDQFVRRSMG